MHFLFINGRFPQYSQTFVHDQIRAVKAQVTASVSVFARSLAPFRFENSTPECSQNLIYGRPRNLNLIRRVTRGILRHPLLASKVMFLWKQKKIDFLTSLLVWQLPRSPDIAITHFGNNCDIGVQLKKYVFPKMKNVVVFHGHDVSSYVAQNGWRKYQQASAYIDCAICVNKKWADLLSVNTTIKEIKTVYLGTTIHPVRRQRNGDDNTYSILFVGRFIQKKGFEILYAAVKNIEATVGRPARVHCVGDGPLLNSFMEQAISEGLAEVFIFYGSKQKSFVEQLMNECDVLVAPSLTAQDGDSEGLPVVLLEAMAAGIPVISTYHSGIPEAITHGTTGLLVPESNVGILEDAIRFAMVNPKTLTGMAEEARKHVEQAHDEAVQISVFLDAVRGRREFL